MLGHNPFYHRTIRKYVTIFGALFNDITFVRRTHDGIEKERQQVPISYAPKEKFLTRLQSDPTLTKSIAITVPRFSFEMLNMQYDQSRKQPSTIRHMVAPVVGKGSTTSQYIGVPYNFEFMLSLYVRNIEDGLQIVEQVLPFFLPDFTVTAQVSQELNIVKDIPIILKSVSEKIDYEGTFTEGTGIRLIMWDFEFSLKGWLFGPVNNSALIMGVQTITGSTPVLDTQYNLGGDGTGDRLRAITPYYVGGANGNPQLGIRFQANTSGPLTSANVDVSHDGTTGGGHFWLTLQTDSGGFPSGTVLAISDQSLVDATPLSQGDPGGSVAGNANWKMNFSTPYSIVAGTLYWLVMRGDYTPSDANVLWWNTSNIGPLPVNYKAASQSTDGITWQDNTSWSQNFQYQAFVGGSTTSVRGGVTVNLIEDVNNKTFQKVIVTGGNTGFLTPELVTSPTQKLTGKVYNWNGTSNTLYLSNMSGVLKVGDELFGMDTAAHWFVQTVEVTNQKDATIWIYQKPITANEDSDYGYTTFINEFPNT